MNTLDWIVKELTTTLEDYISENKQYFEFLQIDANTSSAVTGEAQASDSAAQTTSLVSEVKAISASEELSYAERAKLTVASLLFTNVSLKSEKYQEAVQFVARVKAIVDREMKYDRDDIKRKIADLSRVLDDELAKMVEILRMHGQPSGTYDALLRIFADMLSWMKRDENLDMLSVAIKYEMLHEKHKDFKTPIKINNSNYFIPLPLTQNLVTYLTRQVLALHLDSARNKEHERIPYVLLLPEVQAENVIDRCTFHIMAIEQHTNQNNCKESFSVRQNNNLIVLNCLRMQFTDIYDTMQGYFLATKNPFMDEMLKKLKEWSLQAEDRIRERVKAAIEARLGASTTLLI